MAAWGAPPRLGAKIKSVPLEDLSKLLQDWKRSLQNRNRAPRTIDSYMEVGQAFLDWLVREARPTVVGDIDKRTVEDYLTDLAGRHHERTLDKPISERTREGLAAARARGRKGGRRPVLSEAKVDHARMLRDGGEHTMTEIAELVGCSRATLYRVLEPMPAIEQPSSIDLPPVSTQPVRRGYGPGGRTPSRKVAAIREALGGRAAVGPTES